MLRGGSGDDILGIGDATFLKAVGGTGNDTLRLDGTFDLDLTAIADNRVTGIEEIDITGTGNNTLTLDPLELLNLSGNSNRLVVDGDAGDSIVGGAGWTPDGQELIGGETFDRFLQGNAELVVNNAIDQTGIGTLLPAIELSDVAAGTGGFVMRGADPADDFGFSVSGAGDVDDDGLDDLVVGAVQADPNGVDRAGESYVVFGKADGTIVQASDLAAGTGGFVMNGTDVLDFSGRSVSDAGDVNGDGLDDVIVGARNAAPNGESYVLFGKADGTSVELSDVVSGTGGFVINGNLGSPAGLPVGNAGDVNGDGLDDLIVGDHFADPNGIMNAGASYVVFGKTNGTAVELSDVVAGIGGFVMNGIDADDSFAFEAGNFASSAGDVNGDGLVDLIVGAARADPNGNAEAGESYVVFGKTDGTAVELSDVAAGTGGFVMNGIDAGDNSGLSVSGAGDVNGDGLDDLIIGAY